MAENLKQNNRIKIIQKNHSHLFEVAFNSIFSGLHGAAVASHK